MPYLGIVGSITTIELIFAAVLLKRYLRTKRPLTLCVLLICIGLFIDAFFITIGGPAGGLPDYIGTFRFMAHGLLVPILIPVCGYGLKCKPLTMKILWAITAVISILGLSHAFAIQLETVNFEGIIRHTMGSATPMWAMIVSYLLSFGTVIPLIISGIVIWKKQKNPFLFLSGILMFFFAGLGPAIGKMDLLFIFSMFGEVLMIVFALLYIIKDEKSL
ncbi:hypothetical protein [Butyrivibrio sp. VCB2006]|uniref:hypothetical protein n=1 Tax=Butyrivibrio sp. VCB2006 TaxID=1280679 RepID=UPI0004126F7E|nr:hypothetical protein [Butyrivibrio sp. VCB2006]